VRKVFSGANSGVREVPKGCHGSSTSQRPPRLNLGLPSDGPCLGALEEEPQLQLDALQTQLIRLSHRIVQAESGSGLRHRRQAPSNAPWSVSFGIASLNIQIPSTTFSRRVEPPWLPQGVQRRPQRVYGTPKSGNHSPSAKWILSSTSKSSDFPQYYTLHYNFKPASIDLSKPGSLLHVSGAATGSKPGAGERPAAAECC